MDTRARAAASEEVQAQYRLVPGEKEDTLIVDLTGFKNEAEFKKEHLKIQIDNFGNLKVSGERPLPGGRGNRFQRVIQLPENCDASEIRATYDEGILSVVMPKLVSEQPAPPSPAPAPARAETARKPPTAAQAAPTPAPPPTPAKASTAAPARPKTKPPAPAGYTEAAAAYAAAAAAARRPEDGKIGGKTVPEKGKEKVAAPAEDRGKAAVTEKESEPAAGARTPSSPPAPAEKATPQVTPPPAVAEEEEEKPKLGMAGVDLGALRGPPRQLLVNVVVAVLVLVGLGFYLVYRYRSAGVDQNQPGSLSDS